MGVVELATELVSIPSHEDPREAGDLIETWLRERTDARVERDDAAGGGNVVARKGSGEALGLIGHHDVVAPAESQQADGRYHTRVEDGRLYGRGSADMKGALAAMLRAFRDAEPAGELVFGSFVGEEQGGLGAQAAIEDGFAPAYAVVGEGSTGYSAAGVTDVAVAHNGRRGSELRVQGESAHASEPENAENAIYRAVDAIEVVRELPAPATTVLGHELSGSVVVTEIEGGSAWNVVPAACTVTIDERTVPGERTDLSAATDLPGVELALLQDLPPMQCDDPAFAAAARETAARAQDGDPEQVVKPHATDAGRLAAAGTTCVVCGPAEPGEAHTAGESVGIDVLERCERIYRRLAESWPKA